MTRSTAQTPKASSASSKAPAAPEPGFLAAQWAWLRKSPLLALVIGGIGVAFAMPMGLLVAQGLLTAAAALLLPSGLVLAAVLLIRLARGRSLARAGTDRSGSSFRPDGLVSAPRVAPSPEARRQIASGRRA